MAKSNPITDKLKGLKKAWSKAEAREGFAPIPDGTYQCRLDSATVETSKNGDRLQIKYVLTVVSGDQVNRKLFKYEGMDTEENLAWLKGSLAAIDVELPDDIEELPETLTEMQGMGLEVTVKTKNEYQNIYFNEAIDLDEVGEEDEDEKPVAKPANKNAKVKSKGKPVEEEEEENKEEEEEEEEPAPKKKQMSSTKKGKK